MVTVRNIDKNGKEIDLRNVTIDLSEWPTLEKAMREVIENHTQEQTA